MLAASTTVRGCKSHLSGGGYIQCLDHMNGKSWVCPEPRFQMVMNEVVADSHTFLVEDGQL